MSAVDDIAAYLAYLKTGGNRIDQIIFDELGNDGAGRTDDGVMEKSITARHVAELERENAKLRELVQDMYACIEALCSMVENSPGCSMCPTNQDEEKPCAAADVYCRMRELGVDA